MSARPRPLFTYLLVPVLLLSIVLCAARGAARVLARVLQPSPQVDLQLQLDGWADGAPPPDLLRLRDQNPEWDLLSRTFLSLALVDRALAPEAGGDRVSRAALLATVDAVIIDTLAALDEHGQRHFLMSYADAAPWLGDGRSLFVDGEVALILGARRLAARELGQPDHWREPQQAWVAAVVEDLRGSALEGAGLGLAESYPDEGWTFCHALALVALRLDEVLEQADHRDVINPFLATARTRLIDPPTGLLNSEFTLQAQRQDGPEGSSIWVVAVALQVVDPAFALQQYQRARRELGGSVLGLGYAREWPRSSVGQIDVDSGPLVPLIDASASSSGFALAASRAFADDDWRRRLRAALGAAELIMSGDPALARAADSSLGQAVVLWGLGFGPLWERLVPPS